MKIKFDKFDKMNFKYIEYCDYMYIIADQENHIKVGISKDPNKRLLQLQTGHPTKLQLLYTEKFECKRSHLLKIEALVHKKISSKYRHATGEWFEATPEQIEDIKNIIIIHRIEYEDRELYFKYGI